MSFVVGLTGPTGAGKSSVTAVAENLGFKIVDCDKLSRVAVEKGSEGLLAVVDAFGEDVLNKDKSLNRAVLAQKAFSTPENTELLNKTLLPYIMTLVKAELDCDLVLLDAPTLFESGADNLCDEVIAVISDEKTRLDRIMARDNIDEEAALLRIKAGKPDEFYIEKTNNIVYNDCEISVLNLKIQKLLTKLMEEYNNV
ncbi:MAG: dephospho-CoA kinase [Clostridia bacterium]|nr:dephospho-CoA kinase [Clostridia bacterium]MBR4116545.1 dephospho-CoA kinase [Clostridia bacterium]